MPKLNINIISLKAWSDFQNDTSTLENLHHQKQIHQSKKQKWQYLLTYGFYNELGIKLQDVFLFKTTWNSQLWNYLCNFSLLMSKNFVVGTSRNLWYGKEYWIVEEGYPRQRTANAGSSHQIGYQNT